VRYVLCMTRCDRCREEAVIFIRYSGQHLCGDHFLSLLSRRVMKELRTQGFRSRTVRVGLAVSGGKDSVLLARMISDVTHDMRGVELVLLTVDEGIANYRPSSIAIARGLSREYGMDHDTLSFEEMAGSSLDGMVKEWPTGPCSICGILRRRALNILGKRNACDNIMTGHNLDDMSQTIMMNVLSSDLDRFARLGPHRKRLEGMVPRLFPLRTTPESETLLACYILGLPIHGQECPYAVSAKRGWIRDLVLRAESFQPGTRHSLLSFADKLRPLVSAEREDAALCPVCGEATFDMEGDTTCRTCRIIRNGGRYANEEEKA